MKKLFFVLLSLALILMVLTTTSCKKTYDIRGTWTATFQWNVATPGKLMSNGKVSSEKVYTNTCQITFSGDETSGTFVDCFSDGGTWSVDGDKVSWKYSNNTTYSGTIKDDNNMSGTMVDAWGYSGTWSATR